MDLPPANVVLISGPAGSGKTTSARTWAQESVRPAAHFSVDEMSLAVVSGHMSGAETGSKARRQWLLAVEATGAAAQRYAVAGLDCAIDAYVLPEHLPLWSWAESFERRIVVLLPDVEAAVARNAERRATDGWGVPDWQVRANHESMSAWRDHDEAHVIDNTNAPVPDVVAMINTVCQ